MKRTTEEIQRDIAATRGQVEEMLAALQRKLSPSELIEEAMNYFRTNPGEAGRYVSRAAREHPVSLSLAGIGIGLLAFAAARACMRSETSGHYRPDHPAYPRYGAYSQGATTFGQPAGGPARNEAFGQPEDFSTRGDLYPDTRGPSGGYTDGGGEHRASMSDRAYRGYEAARHGFSEGYHSARHATDDAMHYVGRQARYVGDQARRAGSSASHFVREEPLMAAAAGLAIGAILGALLPMTRRENRAIGHESDSFRQRMRDAAREGYHRAGRVAEATYDSAKEEARRQGFSREGVNAAAEDIEKRTASVYSSAMDTAKREAERNASSSTSSSPSSSSSTSSSTKPTASSATPGSYSSGSSTSSSTGSSTAGNGSSPQT